MRQRQLLYQLSFYINLLAVLFFIGLVINNIYENSDRNLRQNDLSAAFVIMISVGAIYILQDFTGFFLIRKKIKKERIAQRTAAFIWVLTIVHLLLQLLTGYATYDLYQTLYDWNNKRSPDIEIPAILYVVFALILSIFLTGIYNTFAVMVLKRKSRNTRQQIDELISDIGSSK